MRKLMIILLAFIAVITFIRAFDNSGGIRSAGIQSDRIKYEIPGRNDAPVIPGSIGDSEPVR